MKKKLNLKNKFLYCWSLFLFLQQPNKVFRTGESHDCESRVKSLIAQIGWMFYFPQQQLDEITSASPLSWNLILRALTS